MSRISRDNFRSVRNIGKCYGSVSGRYSFRGTEIIQFESTLERDFIKVHELDINVEAIVSQPFTLEYHSRQKGKLLKYTPDFLVLFNSSHFTHSHRIFSPPLVVEVKPYKKWTENWRDWSERWKACIAYCQREGYQFRLYDESRIRTIKLKNIQFLQRFRNLSYGEEEQSIVLQRVEFHEAISVKGLLDEIYGQSSHRATGLGIVWKLVLDQRVMCDLDEPLSVHTELWVNDEQKLDFSMARSE